VRRYREEVAMKLYALFAAAGAAVAFFFDPQSGRRRRHMAWDRTTSFVKRKGRRLARVVTAETYGITMKARHLREAEKPQPNDATLVQKVESEVFRDPAIPKGRINVNAENGVVFLRGEVDSPALIDLLEKETREVKGVRGVENLLHLAPGSAGSPTS
jgi:osmotically-inducible protein OsmY